MQEQVPGTTGYERVVDSFHALSEGLAFEELHAWLLPLLPDAGARVLDVGAGTGRDAAALATRGYEVVAVEPFERFRALAAQAHRDLPITWLEGSLPRLDALADDGGFALVLCYGVWQHIDDVERPVAMRRFAELLAPGGILALALRHGAPGAGTHYFEPDLAATRRWAEEVGLALRLCHERVPSAIPGKPVTWTRLAFERLEA